MQGWIDADLLRREAHTAFRFLSQEPLIAILPTRHRLKAATRIGQIRVRERTAFGARRHDRIYNLEFGRKAHRPYFTRTL